MNIALLGYGKMGRMIETLVAKEDKHSIVLKVNSSNRQSLTGEKLKEADVAIEFSTPASALSNILFCLENGVPVVAGTTGWQDQLDQVRKTCTDHSGSLVFASNFSIGVNLFFLLNQKLAELMKTRGDYNPIITEIHHTSKKDAPSGTAVSLGNDLVKISSSKSRWVNHESDNPSELIILSRREANVVGIHTVEYNSPVDKIGITHEAFSREGFANGAIRAAEWIIRNKGMYEFREIMNQL